MPGNKDRVAYHQSFRHQFVAQTDQEIYREDPLISGDYCAAGAGGFELLFGLIP